MCDSKDNGYDTIQELIMIIADIQIASLLLLDSALALIEGNLIMKGMSQHNGIIIQHILSLIFYLKSP